MITFACLGSLPKCWVAKVKKPNAISSSIGNLVLVLLMSIGAVDRTESHAVSGETYHPTTVSCRTSRSGNSKLFYCFVTLTSKSAYL